MICMAMFGNGVAIGVDLIAAVAKPILRDLHRALLACSVAVVGTTMRASAGVRFVPAIPQNAAATA
jgi:hypothetical protein